MSSHVISDGAASSAPEQLARVTALMSSYELPWSLCGGWAIDSWLGRVSREHGDTDVSVFAQDHEAVFEHLRGWQLVNHGPGIDDNAALWDGRPLPSPSHLHGRPPELVTGPPPESGIMMPADGWWLDVQIDDRAGDEWVLHGQPRLGMALDRAVRESPWGLPVPAPEVLLFFKAKDMRRRDRADFESLLPLLDRGQRAWLREALERVGHPWLGRLGDAVAPA